MAEVVNLRLARKAKVRGDKVREAAANRAKFGRSKAQKASGKAEAERTEKLLDGAKRDTD